MAVRTCVVMQVLCSGIRERERDRAEECEDRLHPPPLPCLIRDAGLKVVVIGVAAAVVVVVVVVMMIMMTI